LNVGRSDSIKFFCSRLDTRRSFLTTEPNTIRRRSICVHYNKCLFTVLSDTCLTLQWRTAVWPTTAVTLCGEMSSNSGLCTGVPFCDVGCTFCSSKPDSIETRTKKINTKTLLISVKSIVRRFPLHSNSYGFPAFNIVVHGHDAAVRSGPTTLRPYTNTVFLTNSQYRADNCLRFQGCWWCKRKCVRYTWEVHGGSGLLTRIWSTVAQSNRISVYRALW
jgi:hypothetical protein